MLRLYRVMGDNKIMVRVLARRLGLKDPKTLRRKLRGASPFTSFERCRVEALLKQAGIRYTGSLWEQEPDFEHEFFVKEALALGPSKASCVERLEGFGNGARHLNGVRVPGTISRIIDFGKEVVPMAMRIQQDVLVRFGLARDPFLNDLHSAEDVFMSRAHERVEKALLDAATFQHFVALVADVGSGKTTLLKRVLDRIGRDKQRFHVSRLRCIEKEESSAYGIIEALIRDFSADTPKRSREARARQIGAILQTMVKDGQHPVLAIDDAQALDYRCLRALKRLYDETESGFRRSIGIIICGQMGNKGDASQNLDAKLGNWDLREVSERCQLVRLSGLGNQLGDYIAFKLARAGARGDGKGIVLPEAVKLLGRSYDTPLAVNNVVAIALTLAHEVGKKDVTEELMADAIHQAQSGSL